MAGDWKMEDPIRKNINNNLNNNLNNKIQQNVIELHCDDVRLTTMPVYTPAHWQYYYGTDHTPVYYPATMEYKTGATYLAYFRSYRAACDAALRLQLPEGQILEAAYKNCSMRTSRIAHNTSTNDFSVLLDRTDRSLPLLSFETVAMWRIALQSDPSCIDFVIRDTVLVQTFV